MSKMEDGVSEISQKDVYDTEDPFFEVRACLEQGDTLRAQQLLESFSERGAEWQYMQAIVSREKKWYTEARRCLKRALKESPENETYQKEYDDLCALAQKGKSKKSETKADMGGAAADCCVELCCVGTCTFVCEGCLDGI